MTPFRTPWPLARLIFVFLFAGTGAIAVAAGASVDAPEFPRTLESYASGEQGLSLGQILLHRIRVEPFNAVATALFLLAILHTFAAPKLLHLSHHYKEVHEARLRVLRQSKALRPGETEPVSFRAEVLHFLGEIEAVFGIWVIPLMIALVGSQGWSTAQRYLSDQVNYTEPLFVVVIMAIAASRPILRLAETMMGRIAGLGRGTPGAWWLTILTVGPVLGSFITEPAAMTISALLLLENFYRFNPSMRLRYATLGLLFVNISVGGTLTHFAAPPVLMVAGRWGWGLEHMVLNFGWKAIVGILAANTLYYLFFRRELSALAGSAAEPSESDVAEDHWAVRRDRIPVWITVVHLLALAWTVLSAHYSALFIGGFLLFLAFVQATAHHQNPISLRSPILVGFFLAGLVVHGGLQQWWIAPVLSSLSPTPLMLGATVLTAFNDNAAITYLATLVPGFTDEMKYAVVAGAVTGGGLTVIANAPNPAGLSILGSSFKGGVNALHLALAALAPTLILGIAFLFL